jgi:hypothetical protein
LVLFEKFSPEHVLAALPSLLKCTTGEREVVPLPKTLLATKTSPVLMRAIPTGLPRLLLVKGTSVEKLGKADRKTWFSALSTTSRSPTYFCVIPRPVMPELPLTGTAEALMGVLV